MTCSLFIRRSFGSIDNRCRLVFALAAQSLSFPSLTLDFCLVGVNLTLLFCLFYFLSLELVAN
jgi:hypothetical protein